MQTSDVIAVIALVISLWSAFISYKAFNHSVKIHDLETTLAFERDKSELLMHVESSRNHFAAALSEIENVKFVLDHEPVEVQQALHSYQNLFTDFLPKLVGAERQASILWHEIYEWRDKSGRSAFAHHTPRFRSLIDNDKMVHDMALRCVSEVRGQIQRAHDAYARGHLG